VFIIPQHSLSHASRNVCHCSHLCIVRKADSQSTISKPKNARSKRALEAREPKEVEDPRTVIFVRGTHTGEVVNGVMKDLVSRPLSAMVLINIIVNFFGDVKMALKRPHAISFSKKNVVRPFEDVSSLEFWAHKNDASMFVLGQSTKKRPNGLTIARMFDGKLLDMCELGVDQFVSMNDFKV
jgi:ribosome production factor 2